MNNRIKNSKVKFIEEKNYRFRLLTRIVNLLLLKMSLKKEKYTFSTYFLMISLLILTIAVQGILELTGTIRNNLSPHTWGLDALILTVFFILLAFVGRYFTDGLYKALNEAHLNARNYRSIFQSTADGSFIDADDSALRILGYSRKRRIPSGCPISVPASRATPFRSWPTGTARRKAGIPSCSNGSPAGKTAPFSSSRFP